MHRRRASCCLGLAAVVAVLVASTVTAQQSAWPAARARHHMAYDSRSGEVLLLGGAQRPAAGARADTALWGWNGTAWRVLSRTPPKRDNAAAAYDAGRNRFVVHGGSAGDSGELDETWEWDGESWQTVSNSGPGARAHHAMAYDATRKRVVLFGNSDDAPANDTWAWDGRAWTMLANDGPPRRGVCALAFDDKRGVLVLFGGYGSRNTILNDTWEWDGQRWKQVVTPVAPSPRWDVRAVYDPARGRVVLFGGRDATGNLGDTWEYDGGTWTRLDIAGPSPRNGHAVAYDPRTKAILLFGGRRTEAGVPQRPVEIRWHVDANRAPLEMRQAAFTLRVTTRLDRRLPRGWPERGWRQA